VTEGIPVEVVISIPIFELVPVEVRPEESECAEEPSRSLAHKHG
jgi:hypothetical protein